MKVLSVFRHCTLLVCALTAALAGAQNLPAAPPSRDPSFWGHPNKPYVLKLSVTAPVDGETHSSQMRSSEENVSRDGVGRVRTEAFYDSGRPRVMSIRDPNKNTVTWLEIVSKNAFVLPASRPMTPPPGKGWDVERLPSRVIAGFPADGFRFTLKIPASADGQRAEDTVVEDDWISNELSVVLEQKVASQHTGTTVRTVTYYKQVEPDPALFSIPGDYTLKQTPASVSP